MGKKSTPTERDKLTGRRIVEMRKRMGYTQAQLAKMLGITTPTLSGYETGQSDPKCNGIAEIARLLSCSADYLLGLTDDCNPVGPSPISEDSFRRARDFERLDNRGKDLVDLVMGYEEKYSVFPVSKIVELKVYQNAASAGTGNYMDDGYFELMDFPAETVPEKVDFVVRVVGDSMEPDLPDGCYVFVQSCPKIENGETGVFILNGDSYIKRLILDGGVKLHSINPAYSDIKIKASDSLYTCGRVLGYYEKG